MKRCDDCLYRSEPEYNKPCVVYRADCPLYQKEGDGMTIDEAIKELKEMRTDPWTDSRQMQAIELAIKALEQEPRWIPVSERLPEERSRVLVCEEDGYIDTDDYFSYGFDDWEDEVVAWMPLPEPYKAESEDKE